MNNKKSKNKKYDQNDNVISMETFLHDYLGLQYFDSQNLYHRGLKSLEIPLVVGISNDATLKTPECVKNGEVLKVRDSRGHIGTYISPFFLEKYSDIKAQKESIEDLILNLHFNDLKKLKLLSKNLKELINYRDQMKYYIETIQLLTKNDSEAEIKVNVMDMVAEEIQKIKRNSRKLA